MSKFGKHSLACGMVAGVLSLIVSAASAQGQGDRLNLVCLGSGGANQSNAVRTNRYDSEGNSEWGTIIGNRTVPFEDQVNLWIEADEGRLRMPRVMLPMIRGGDDGWFKLQNIEVTDEVITAKVAVNFLNRPDLRIDRYTGVISLNGKAGNYVGNCQRYEPENARRRF